MAAAIQLDPCRDESRGESHLSGRVARKSGGGGGDMDDVLQRLGAVESSLSALRVEVSSITATIAHLATKEELKEIEAGLGAQMNGIAAVIPHLATKADLTLLRAEISGMETKVIKWFIATVIAASGLTSSLAFTIAKLIH
jgi:hypothetical protein